jgi:hypothetical protein
MTCGGHGGRRQLYLGWRKIVPSPKCTPLVVNNLVNVRSLGISVLIRPVAMDHVGEALCGIAEVNKNMTRQLIRWPCGYLHSQYVTPLNLPQYCARIWQCEVRSFFMRCCALQNQNKNSFRKPIDGWCLYIYIKKPQSFMSSDAQKD